MQIHLQILNKDYTVTNSKYQRIQKWYKMERIFQEEANFSFVKPIFLTSISQQQANLRWEIYGFSLFSICQNERFFSFLSLHIFDESVFIFQLLNDKMHNYVKHTVNFIIQKLKHKHIFLIEYTNRESWGTSQQENLAFSVCILF